MLEEAIPAVWSAVHGWFTPAVLFVLVNIVIGTIAVTSKSATAGEGGGGGGGELRKLSRVPSLALDRLRSFNLSRLSAPAPAPPLAGAVDPSPPPPPEKSGEEDEHVPEHIERSRSEAAGAEEAPRLPARMRKSASEKSSFAHFDAEAEALVEARRPATTREARVGGGTRGGELLAAGEEPEAAAEEGGEVDARADDFINRFRHQLKLQRLDSFMRYKEMLRRGTAE